MNDFPAVDTWHAFGKSVEGRATAACGQALEITHGLTSELAKIYCRHCLLMVISEQAETLRRIEALAGGRA
jgi:hypothetical protein